MDKQATTKPDNGTSVELSVLLALLKPALDRGCRFELFSDAGILTIDLNTGAKSGCQLKLEPGGVKAYRRYDRVDTVETFEDVMWVVHGCAHGRDFFSQEWLDIFKDNGISDPRG